MKTSLDKYNGYYGKLEPKARYESRTVEVLDYGQFFRLSCKLEIKFNNGIVEFVS